MTIFPRSLGLVTGPARSTKKVFEIVKKVFLQPGCPSYHLINRVKAHRFNILEEKKQKLKLTTFTDQQ